MVDIFKQLMSRPPYTPQNTSIVEINQQFHNRRIHVGKAIKDSRLSGRRGRVGRTALPQELIIRGIVAIELRIASGRRPSEAIPQEALRKLMIEAVFVEHTGQRGRVNSSLISNARINPTAAAYHITVDKLSIAIG